MSNLNENVNPRSLIETLKDANVNLSQPKEIKEVLESMSLEVIGKFHTPSITAKLLAGGMYRELSANMSKGVKVGTDEYAKEVENKLTNLWAVGYIKQSDYDRAHRVEKSKGVVSQPFSREEIQEEIGQLLPTGKSDKSVAARKSLETLISYSDEKFQDYLLAIMDNPKSLGFKALRNLSQNKVEREQEEMKARLADVVEL